MMLCAHLKSNRRIKSEVQALLKAELSRSGARVRSVQQQAQATLAVCTSTPAIAHRLLEAQVLHT